MPTEEGPALATLEELKVRGENAIAATREIIRDMKRLADAVRRDAETMIRGARILR